jgi:Holliday junction DNA helicase RuvA
MISSLRGTLVQKSPTELVIDVQGVGYGVSIPLSTYQALGEPRSQVLLHTYLHVREDALQLYGFATEEERNAFRLLISVNGIGPKMAQGILSGLPVSDLKGYIARGNSSALTAIPGVGRKLAERLVVELRDKIGRLGPEAESAGMPADLHTKNRAEALSALLSLGYHRTAAEKALRSALSEADGSEPTVEVLVKLALRHAAQ